MNPAKPPRANQSVVRLLLVDDDDTFLGFFAASLGTDGFSVATAGDGEVALSTVASFQPTIVLTDLVMPGLGGIEFLKRLRWIAPTVPVVVLTGHGDVYAAQECYKYGASCFLTKPIAPHTLARVMRAVAHGLADPRSQAQLKRFLRWLARGSKVLRPLQAQLLGAARSADSVLLIGDSQTTQAAARLIHALGPRHLMDFLTVRCQADISQTVERIFGKDKRASKQEGQMALLGALDLARGGTLHIDAIEMLPLDVQARLRANLGRPPHRQVRLLLSTESAGARSVNRGHRIERVHHDMYDRSILLPKIQGEDCGVMCLLESVANRCLLMARLAAAGPQEIDREKY